MTETKSSTALTDAAVKARRGSSDFRIASGRFEIKMKLGGGSFGDIYRGIDTWRNNKEVALKLEQTKAQHQQLAYESKVYKLLHQGPYEVVGIPEMHWFGVEGDFNVMALDLLGPSLEDLFNYCCRKFSPKTVSMLGDQLMHRMEFVHSRHMIHRDIKPENFVMGTGDKSHHVYVLDFGLSKKYWDTRNNSHIPFKEGKPLTGTARYCSSNTHLGYEQSRRDDLESIGYLLIYFLVGSLPWQGISAPDLNTKTARIGERKVATPVEILCHDCPVQMVQYMKYCKGLKFDEQPDYTYLRKLFAEMGSAVGATRDWVFDWASKRRLEVGSISMDASNKDGDQNTNEDMSRQVQGTANTGTSLQI